MSNLPDMVEAFELYNELIYRYIYVRVARQRDVAEDLTQDVFLKAWQHRLGFDPRKSSLKNWLFVIALNTLRDHYRTRKAVQQLDETLAAPAVDSEERLDQKMKLDLILSRMRTMSEFEQELLTLRYISDLPLQDIAHIVSKKPTATRVAMHRAVQRLKEICNAEIKE